MDLAKAHTLFSLLGHDRFDLLYSGKFHDEHTPGLITLAEEAVLAGAGAKGQRQRLSFVMVEAYQNIVRHRADVQQGPARNSDRSLFLLRSGEGNEVVAINAVRQDEVEALEAVLRRISGSDAGQLKSLFLDRLREGQRSVRGGAGLGLIEMARRSENGLRHALVPLDAEHRLFLLQILVGASKRSLTEVDEVRRIHELCGELDLLLLCRCGASSTALDIMLQMIARDLDENASRAVCRSILSMVEWLRTSPFGTDAYIALLNEPNGYQVLFGSGATGAQEQEATALINRINALSVPQREQYYRDAVLGRASASDDFPLGLLDLARSADGPLQWGTFKGLVDRCVLLSARLR